MTEIDLVSVVSGFASSALTTGVAWGVMKNKIDRLEKDMEKAEKSYVPIDLFHATIDPIRKDLHEMQRDIKKILVAVNSNNAHNVHGLQGQD